MRAKHIIRNGTAPRCRWDRQSSCFHRATEGPRYIVPSDLDWQCPDCRGPRSRQTGWRCTQTTFGGARWQPPPYLPRAPRWTTFGHSSVAATARGAPPDNWTPTATTARRLQNRDTQHGQARRVRITDDHWSSALVPWRTIPLKPGAYITAQHGGSLLV